MSTSNVSHLKKVCACKHIYSIFEVLDPNFAIKEVENFSCLDEPMLTPSYKNRLGIRLTLHYPISFPFSLWSGSIKLPIYTDTQHKYEALAVHAPVGSNFRNKITNNLASHKALDIVNVDEQSWDDDKGPDI